MVNHQKTNINKSLLTNGLALGLIIMGWLSPVFSSQLLSTGMYALSGAVTNWLAIHMLFEKVPGLYGSGIIPNKFEEFKSGIRELMMQEFFTQENIERFFAHAAGTPSKLDLKPVVAILDYDKIFQKLLESITQSPLGGMLAMVGGAEALEPIKEPAKEKIKEAISEIVEDQNFLTTLEHQIAQGIQQKDIQGKVASIVEGRLDELSPQMVKIIIQNMIKEHLGWLVVWGGVFGGLIGLVASFVVS